MRKILTQCLLLLGGLLAPAAGIACSWAPNPVPVGTVPTQRVYEGNELTASGVFPFKCSGTLATLLSNKPRLRASFPGDLSNLKLKNAAQEIPYQVFLDGNHSSAPTQGVVLLEILDLSVLNVGSSGPDIKIPVHFRIPTGPNIPAGTYTDTLQLAWDVAHICMGIYALDICIGVSTEGVKVASMTITLTVTNDCTITAPPVNFGSAPLPSGFPSVTQSILFKCSPGATYSVGLSFGNAHTGTRRQMSSGSNRLAYDLFKASDSVWGPTGLGRVTAPSVPDGITVQSIPYTARVYSDQDSPPAGTYTDNVVVDVAW